MNFFEKNKRLIIRICLIILFTGIILVITKLTYQFSSITSATTSAFCFLIAVLFSAYFGDIIIAIVTSLIATICFDYFYLPPVGKFTIAAFPDAIALTTFLITAVLTSRLTSAAALNAKNTRYFEQTSTDLNELALWLIQTSKEQLTLSEIARQILHTFKLEYCAVHIYGEGKWSHFSGSAKRDISQYIERSGLAGIRDHKTGMMELVDENFLGVQYAQVEIDQKPFALLVIKSDTLYPHAVDLIARMISLCLLKVQ